MEDVEKVDVVREPANAEQDHNHNEHLDNILLALLGLHQGVREVSNDVVLPELGAHPGVGHAHHQPRHQVGQKEEDTVETDDKDYEE